MNRPQVIVCVATDRAGPVAVDQAVQDTCADCGTPVWRSRAVTSRTLADGKLALVPTPADVIPLCTECAMIHALEHGNADVYRLIEQMHRGDLERLTR